MSPFAAATDRLNLAFKGLLLFPFPSTHASFARAWDEKGERDGGRHALLRARCWRRRRREEEKTSLYHLRYFIFVDCSNAGTGRIRNVNLNNILSSIQEPSTYDMTISIAHFNSNSGAVGLQHARLTARQKSPPPPALLRTATSSSTASIKARPNPRSYSDNSPCCGVRAEWRTDKR